MIERDFDLGLEYEFIDNELKIQYNVFSNPLNYGSVQRLIKQCFGDVEPEKLI